MIEIVTRMQLYKKHPDKVKDFCDNSCSQF